MGHASILACLRLGNQAAYVRKASKQSVYDGWKATTETGLAENAMAAMIQRIGGEAKSDYIEKSGPELGTQFYW
ncbi:MAG: hypothetical protein ACRECP_02635 [Methylocella sp.]